MLRGGNEAHEKNPKVPRTAAGMDSILSAMERAFHAVDAAQGRYVALANTEINLLKKYEIARDVMLDILTNQDRSNLQHIFGGDCSRIARMHAILNETKFSDRNVGDQRIATLTCAVESVEQVLKDLGVGAQLRDAKNEQKALLDARRAKTPSQTPKTQIHSGISLPVEVRERSGLAYANIMPQSPVADGTSHPAVLLGSMQFVSTPLSIQGHRSPSPLVSMCVEEFVPQTMVAVAAVAPTTPLVAPPSDKPQILTRTRATSFASPVSNLSPKGIAPSTPLAVTFHSKPQLPIGTRSFGTSPISSLSPTTDMTPVVATANCKTQSSTRTTLFGTSPVSSPESAKQLPAEADGTPVEIGIIEQQLPDAVPDADRIPLAPTLLQQLFASSGGEPGYKLANESELGQGAATRQPQDAIPNGCVAQEEAKDAAEEMLTDVSVDASSTVNQDFVESVIQPPDVFQPCTVNWDSLQSIIRPPDMSEPIPARSQTFRPTGHWEDFELRDVHKERRSVNSEKSTSSDETLPSGVVSSCTPLDPSRIRTASAKEIQQYSSANSRGQQPSIIVPQVLHPTLPQPDESPTTAGSESPRPESTTEDEWEEFEVVEIRKGRRWVHDGFEEVQFDSHRETPLL